MQEETVTIDSPRVASHIPRREIPCNLCGSSEHKPFCPENECGLVQCLNCGLVYVGRRPDPEELYALYSETYFRNGESGVVGYTNYLKDETNIRKTFAGRLKRLERWAKPGKLLDIGCAAGFFLDEAFRRGWQVQGMDVSGFAVDYVRDRFEFDVQQGSLTDLKYPEGAYDLITMWDVIEHIPDPKTYVHRVAALLRPGGVFSLATPDVDSIPAQLTGKRWMGYKLADEHIYYFSIKTLKSMLNECGFEVVDVRHVGKYVTMSLFVNRLALYAPVLAKIAAFLERVFRLSGRSFYVNPLDIVAITARKR